MKKTKTAALICEFNPLHTGHEHILHKMGEERNILCIMSGNFVQRGGGAIADKYTRAETAVLSGADLVIELPFPHAMGSAEYFAMGAVSVLDRLGCVDELWFGCECGDSTLLSEIAENMLTAEYETALKESKSDEGYASACLRVYTYLFGSCPVLEKPNNLLAIEYIKALKKIGSGIEPVAIRRDGDFLSETLEDGKFPSATALRKVIYETGRIPEGFVPKHAADVFKNAKDEGLFPAKENSVALLALLRLWDTDKSALSSGALGGLSNRITKTALDSATSHELYSKLSTKKYTDARIRRTVYNCLFGVTDEDLHAEPDYAQILAFGNVGREILSDIRKTSRIPLVTKPADVPKGSRQAELTDISDSYFTLTLPRPRDAGHFKKCAPRTPIKE